MYRLSNRNGSLNKFSFCKNKNKHHFCLTDFRINQKKAPITSSGWFTPSPTYPSPISKCTFRNVLHSMYGAWQSGQRRSSRSPAFHVWRMRNVHAINTHWTLSIPHSSMERLHCIQWRSKFQKGERVRLWTAITSVSFNLQRSFLPYFKALFLGFLTILIWMESGKPKARCIDLKVEFIEIRRSSI